MSRPWNYSSLTVSASFFKEEDSDEVTGPAFLPTQVEDEDETAGASGAPITQDLVRDRSLRAL